MKCPKCDVFLKENQRFCTRCGTKIEAKDAKNFPPELIAGIDIHEKRIAQDPLNPQLYIDLGDLYQDHQRQEEALVQYQKAASIETSLAEAYMKSGFIYNQLKQFDKGASTFAHVLRLNPNSTAAELGLVESLTGSQKFAEAEEVGKRIIQREPSNVATHKLLRDIYVQQGNVSKAISELTMLIALIPGESENYLILGDLYCKNDEKEKALRQYLAMLDINSNDKEALFHAGVLLYNIGRFAESASNLEKLAATDETNIIGVAYLAMAHTQYGDLARARNILKTFDDEEKQSFSKDEARLVSLAYYSLAKKLTEMNRKRDVIQLLSRSLDISWSHDAAEAKALIYAEDGEKALSRGSFREAEVFQEALGIVPDDKSYQGKIEYIHHHLLSRKRRKVTVYIGIAVVIAAFITVAFFVTRYYESVARYHAFGVLTIVYQPQEVTRIEVDGQEYTKYPGRDIELPMGEHTVLVTGREGYKDLSQKVFLNGGEKKELVIALQMKRQDKSQNSAGGQETSGQDSGVENDVPKRQEQITSNGEQKTSVQDSGASYDLISDIIKASLAGNSDKVDVTVRMIEEKPKIQRGNRKMARKLNEQGLELFREKSYGKAVIKFREALQADLGDQEILNNLGFALLENDQLNEAQKMLFAAIMIEPTRTNAWSILACYTCAKAMQKELLVVG